MKTFTLSALAFGIFALSACSAPVKAPETDFADSISASDRSVIESCMEFGASAVEITELADGVSTAVCR